MRSLSTIALGNREKEDYYTEDESLKDSQEAYYAEGETPSASKTMTQAIWHGNGAKSLGLEGDVARSDFKTVFYGHQPVTEQRIRGERPDKNKKERLAYDLTLSAPKSVSMALHLGGDSRLFDAHLEAVQDTLDQVEALYAQARITVAGERKVFNTENLIAAIIPHHTSREKDMQLHSHCVIMNGTHCPDGQWRSLWHEGIVDAEWLGSYYRNVLAQKVQALGYEIYETRLEKGGSFEIRGYSRGDIEAFSKRSRQIVESLERRGVEVTPENRDGAVLTTRKAKQADETLEVFAARLQAEASTLGISSPTPSQQAVSLFGHRTAAEELESAIRHFSERSVSFSREDLYRYGFDHIQAFGIDDLNQAIAHHPSLMATQSGRFTTVEALEREIRTI
ncbi:MAG: MobF family relaxase, partial [Thermosynechococcaceae cyanobacterium]